MYKVIMMKSKTKIRSELDKANDKLIKQEDNNKLFQFKTFHLETTVWVMGALMITNATGC